MRDGLEAVGLAFVAILCCAGLPLFLAAGVGAAAALWIGGIVLGLAVVAASLAVLALCRRRRAASRARREAPEEQPRHSLKREAQIR